MTIQETSLNQLPEEVVKRLIASQIKQANNILFHKKQRIKSYTFITLSINEVKPSQFGEDYENNSSKYDAEIYKAIISRTKKVEDVRLESLCPIVVDKNTMTIIDGNHRHYATYSIGEKFIYTILCEIENI